MQTVTFQGQVMHLEGQAPKVGQAAPDFSLTANDMSARDLKHYAGKILVVVAVPSLDTPVCDMEVRRFNTLAADLSQDITIVAVSRDLPFAQARWCGASGTKRVEALSDYRQGSFGKSYGLYIQELDLLARAVFIIDRQGQLRYSQLVAEVANEPDYDAVLEALKALV
ncbi:MAG: thiol peroxidase [Desulfovibrionaceae bacterium]|nr:thiol peroxidase [Desulfovibrionaceae bacterium]